MTIDYCDQALNNMVCLLEDKEYRERKEIFLKIVKNFSEKNIGWAIGCSMNLFLRGIVDEFHDLDLIVALEDIPKIKEIMENDFHGILMATGGNGYCESDMYLHYQVDRIDVDVISGFRVMTYGTSYYYQYNKNEIDLLEVVNADITVPLISLEAMFILYFMMEGWQPKRKYKRMLILEYFKNIPPKHKEVFQTALKRNALPGWIRWEIKKFID